MRDRESRLDSPAGRSKSVASLADDNRCCLWLTFVLGEGRERKLDSSTGTLRQTGVSRAGETNSGKQTMLNSSGAGHKKSRSTGTTRSGGSADKLRGHLELSPPQGATNQHHGSPSKDQGRRFRYEKHICLEIRQSCIVENDIA